ncbi:unnamed protein product [Ilex paraguariensis]|uniref:Uncharacterized protein n=1 Tax=Ilex paraguariensis TaxID=185542 RepID=A0ABC8T5M6_9AQUA
MAVRAVNTCSVFRSASSPALAGYRCRMHQFSTVQYWRHSKLGFRLSIFRAEQYLHSYGSVRSYSIQSLVETVMEELQALRGRKRVRATSKYYYHFSSSFSITCMFYLVVFCEFAVSSSKPVRRYVNSVYAVRMSPKLLQHFCIDKGKAWWPNRTTVTE